MNHSSKSSEMYRPPYGRARGRQPADYAGPTYYEQPALKRSHWHHLVIAYFFVGGIAGAGQILAQVADLVGRGRLRGVVRRGRYLALAGSVASPVLLVADLHRPTRWYNMLRMFRSTSTMSIGAWTLSAFGTLSGMTAVAQWLEDRTQRRVFRWLARALGIPAAASGGLLTTYTGTLLAATSTPLWSAAGTSLPVLFGASAMSTATAALTLTGGKEDEDSLPALETIGLLASAGELAAERWMSRRLQERGVAEPLREEPARSLYKLGFVTVGVGVPLAIHAVQTLSGRHSRKASLLAAGAALAGGYALRHVIVTAGNRSAERPRDYFQVAQRSEP